MAKRSTTTKRISQKEWEGLPITFDSDVVARVFGCERRHVTNNAPDFGGVKIAGKWVFSKSKIAALAGIE